jgi:hypothetical protein
VEQEEEAVARQRQSKRVSAAMNQHVALEEVLGRVISMWCTPRPYSEDQQEKLVSQRSVSAVSS